MTSRESIEAFVAQPAIAVVGVSRGARHFGNIAGRELRSRGYRVYPVHPAAAMIEGVRCYRSLEDLPEPVDAALVVVPPAAAIDVVRDVAASGLHYVWLQQGAESPEAIALACSLGLHVVAGECILMFASPAGIHKAHRWLWRTLGKIPA